MIIFSLVTSVKDYFEIAHKLIEFQPNYGIVNYSELGSLITYIILTIKSSIFDFLSFNWLQNLWSLPIVIPDIASAMISEISVLDGYFHNAFTFLETPLSYGDRNYSIYGIEKFLIGLINSFFLFLPTSAAHIIMLRRFVFQGIEAGYIAGLGIIVGNFFWLACLIFGWQFLVIPWLSLDILRYLLGFIILIKYMWHASLMQDERSQFRLSTNLSKSKIFLVNFLLALTEQTNIYPFVTNMSIGAESTIIENFPVENLTQFVFIHSAYLLGILAGSLSLLHFTCWFWENPIYKIYIWFIYNSNFSFNLFKISKTTNYYKYLNLVFLYLTMLCTISSIPYFGLDYTLTNPLGFIADDRILYLNNKKTNLPEISETSFLSVQASDRNTRDSRGRHGRRERWKDRLIKYRGMDLSLYDQSVYDLFTIEDLNYGFDKFWLRRKIKNHHSRFRMVIFQPWLLSLKKQLAKPRLISNDGVRVELFRMLYEQFYHPNFHAYLSTKTNMLPLSSVGPKGTFFSTFLSQRPAKRDQRPLPLPLVPTKERNGSQQKIALVEREPPTNFKGERNSPLLRTHFLSNEELQKKKTYNILTQALHSPSFNNTIYSSIFTKSFQKPHIETKTSFLQKNQNQIPINLIQNTSALRKFVRKINTRIKIALATQQASIGRLFHYQNKKIYKMASPQVESDIKSSFFQVPTFTSKIPINLNQLNQHIFRNEKKQKFNLIKKKEGFLLRYKNFLNPTLISNGSRRAAAQQKLESKEFNNAKIMLHPLKFYLQKESSLRRKWKFYGANIYRTFSIGNNSPSFRTIMKRVFYYYKPTLRWTNTLKLAKNKQGHKVRRKKYRTPLIYNSSHSHSPNSFLPIKKRGGSEATPNSQFFTTPHHTEVSLAHTKTIQSLSFKRPILSGQEPILKKGELTLLKKPTQNYRVVGKNASRYRYQIYKDVLQHWYYTPFNRLLLKFDVDSFIRRQPKSHFLTKNEEQELHLKRFLLADYYETLRWYTYMQHYRSMKTNIGGTKSFASRIYNQQFQGTFKKLRHLFAITPTILSHQVVLPTDRKEPLNQKSSFGARPLKFDQPLYNEYLNTQKNSLIKDSVVHEELLNQRAPSDGARKKKKGQQKSNQNYKSDLFDQSILILKSYLNNSKEKKKVLVENFLFEKNYKDLTKFNFVGQKNRGFKAITNEQSFLKQEKKFLHLTFGVKPPASTFDAQQVFGSDLRAASLKTEGVLLPVRRKDTFPRALFPKGGERAALVLSSSLWSEPKAFFSGDDENQEPKKKSESKNSKLWFLILKNYKKGFYDLEFLTKFLERRIKKKEKRQQKKEKELKNRLKRLQTWLVPLMQTSWEGSYATNFKSQFDFTFKKYEARKPILFGSLSTSRAATKKKSAKHKLLTTGLQKAINEGNFNLKKIKSEFDKKKIRIPYLRQCYANSKKTNSFDTTSTITFNSISTLLLKLKTLKQLKKTKPNQLSSFSLKVYTTFIKTQVVFAKIIALKIKAAAHSLFDIQKKKFFVQKDPLLSWDIKDKMLKKRKRSRKKYTKEIKKARITFINGIKEQRKLDQNSLIKIKEKAKTFNLFSPFPPPLYPSSSIRLSSPFGSLLSKETKHKKKEETKSIPENGSKKEDLKASNLYTNFTKINPFIAQKQASYLSFLTKNKKDVKEKKIKGKKKETGVSLRESGIGAALLVEREKTAPQLNNSAKHKRKKKISEQNNVIEALGDKHSMFLPLVLTKGKNENSNLKKKNFLFLNTFYGTKFAGTLNFRRKKTKNRRNQRYGRPHHRIEHPSFNAFLERKSANMVPEKRLQILKELNFVQIDSIKSKSKEESKVASPQKKTKISSFLWPSVLIKGKNLIKDSSGYFITTQNFENSDLQKRKKSKKRNWKKYKKGINNEKLRKARKQNRETIAVQRTNLLNKQIKRIKFRSKLQQWWWQHFLPKIQETALNKTTWEQEKNRQLKKTISNLSKTEILERDLINISTMNQNLQIGDYDFKPLEIPEAFRIRDNLNQQTLNLNLNSSFSSLPFSFWSNPSLWSGHAKPAKGVVDNQPNVLGEPKSVLSPLSIEDLSLRAPPNPPKERAVFKKHVLNKGKKMVAALREPDQKKFFDSEPLKITRFLLNTNPLPFYAGWDESLRQFVITNRFLSRREAGYSYSLKPKQPASTFGFRVGQEPHRKEFNLPLQGMNAGTTLYCQLPFTTFDPDQFFSKGMDGFAPLGWRRFNFTHTIQKNILQNSIFTLTPLSPLSPVLPFGLAQRSEGNKETLVENNGSIYLSPSVKRGSYGKSLLIPFKSLNDQSNLLKQQNQSLFLNLKKPYQQTSPTSPSPFGGFGSDAKELEFGGAHKIQTLYKYYSRRIKKHYKRIKKLQNEKVPAFLISGPLINEVLPIHYINVFNKQNRLSRDRYLKRRLRRGKKGIPKTIKEFISKKPHLNLIRSDFTLRKRIKTRRKYHRKPYPIKGIEIRPRRHKFYAKFNLISLYTTKTSQSFPLVSRGTPDKQKTKKLNVIRFSKKIQSLTLLPSTKARMDSSGVATPAVSIKNGRDQRQLDLKNYLNLNRQNLRKRPSKRRSKKNLRKDYDSNFTKTRQRHKNQKMSGLNSRLRQLRRRVSRQVLKVVPRRRPRAGGFLWPGDYLRLEQTESPKLWSVLRDATQVRDALTTKKKTTTSPKTTGKEKDKKGVPSPGEESFTAASRKEPLSKEKTLMNVTNKQKIPRQIDKKVLLLDLYVQPRKYLFEKHNLRIYRKRLEKAQRML